MGTNKSAIGAAAVFLTILSPAIAEESTYVPSTTKDYIETCHDVIRSGATNFFCMGYLQAAMDDTLSQDHSTGKCTFELPHAPPEVVIDSVVFHLRYKPAPSLLGSQKKVESTTVATESKIYASTSTIVSLSEQMQRKV